MAGRLDETLKELNGKYGTKLDGGKVASAAKTLPSASSAPSEDVVDSKYVNSFIRNANGFLSRSRDYVNGMTYASTKNHYYRDGMKSTWKELSRQADNIQNFLRSNKDSLQWNDELQSILDVASEFDSDARKLYDTYEHNFKFLEQFENEDQWNWYEKYNGQNSDTLQSVLDTLDDGDEKNWLQGYTNQVYNEELPTVDVEASRKKATSLQQLLDAYRQNSRFGTDAKGEAWLQEIRDQYGGEEGLERAISRENRRANLAAREQDRIRNADRFGKVTRNSDFAQKSAYDPSNTDIGYRYVNGDDWERYLLEKQYGQYVEEFGYHAFDSLTDEEKAVYNYYMNTGDRQSAADYLKHIQDPLNKRKAQQIFEDGYKGNAGLEFVYGIDAGLDQFRSGVAGVGKMIRGDADQTVPSATQYASSLMREDLGASDKKLPSWLGGGTVGQAVYDSVTTTANMVPSILTSAALGLLNPTLGTVAGGATMGAGAAGSAYQEMIDSGYTVSQARTYGTLVGTAEMVLEKLLGGIGKLGGSSPIAKAIAGWADNVDNALINLVGRLGGSAISEGMEEGIQEVFSGWLKSQITKEDFYATPADVLYSSLLGAFTGAIFEAPEAAVKVGTQVKHGHDVIQAKGVDSLTQLGRGSENADIQRMAERAANKPSAYNVGGLRAEVSTEIHRQNTADITKSLTQKGMSQKTAQQYGEMISYMLESGSNTEIQRMVMESDPVVGKTLREIQMPTSSVYQRITHMDEATGKAPSIDRIAAAYGSQAEDVKNVYALGETEPGKNLSVADFSYGFQRVHTLGREGANPSALTEEVAPGLTKDQIKYAYKLGAEAAAAEKAAANKRQGDTSAVYLLNEDGSVGDAAQITGIASMEDGTTSYRLSDGTTVSEDQLSFQGDNMVLSTIRDLGLDTETANVLIRGNNTITAADAVVAQGIDDAYRYGSHGYSLDRLAKDSEAAGALTEEMRRAAYYAGRNDPKKAHKKPPSAKVSARGKKPGVYFDSGNGHVEPYKGAELTGDGVRKAGVQTALVLQKLGIGGDFYFFESYVNQKGERVYLDENGVEQKAPNGWYDPADGSIHIDLNAGEAGHGLTLFTLAHELTHFIEQWSPEKYRVLADFLIKNYEKDRSVDELVQIKQATLSAERGEAVSYEEAYSEVIANSMEAMLADGNVLEKLMELKKRDNTLVEKMKNFFDNLVSKISKYYKSLMPESDEAQVVLQMQEQFTQIQQLFAEALADAGDNYQAAEAQKNTTQEGSEANLDERQPFGRKVQNQASSAGYDYSKPFSQQVDDWVNGNFPESDTLLVGETPSVLTGIGFPPMPITIAQVNLKANINGQYRGTPAEILDHVVSSADFKRLPELLADPVAIIADRRLQHNQWIVSEHVVDVLVEMEINGKQTLVPIKIDGKGMQHGATIDAFSISSLHGNRDAYDRLNYALSNDSDNQILAFYVNKNKATAVLRKAGYTITGWPNSSNGFIHSITDPNSPVKLRITSQTETRQFKKWFRGSKVVNSDGTPKEMYHGTSYSGFTVFDTYGGKFGLFGKGSYFTDNPEVAESYTQKGNGQEPGVYGVYLSIKNPLDMDAKADLKAWEQAFDEAELDSSYLDGIITNEDAFRQLKENLADDGYVRWEAEDIVTAMIEGMGYDGITHIGGGRYGSKDGPKHRVYIAFEPEQIKSSTENIGTFDENNPDIRYQDRPTAPITNRALLANALENTAKHELEVERIREYKEQIANIEAQEAKLAELRAQIRELSFARGPRDMKKLAALRDEATKTANRINIYDKKLLQLESTESLKRVLKREKKKAYDRAQKHGKQVMENYRERRERTVMRHKIERVVNELNKLLTNPTKTNHVLPALQKPVAEMLEALNMGTEEKQEQIRKSISSYQDKIQAEMQKNTPDQENIDAWKGKIAQLERRGDKLSSNMEELKNAYAQIQNSSDFGLKDAYLPEVAERLEIIQQEVGDTPLQDMSLEQMDIVYDAYKMILHRVRVANKAFRGEKGKTIAAMAESAMTEINSRKKRSKLSLPGSSRLSKMDWDNMKPIYAMERIGSATMNALFGRVRGGEDTWITDLSEARNFQNEKAKKYDFDKWDFDKRYEFTAASGDTFSLDLEKIMSIYAYSKRKQAEDHLAKGGVVFAPNTKVVTKSLKGGIKVVQDLNDATAYNLPKDVQAEIIDTLTDNQKAYVDEMRDYLSDVMGAKGNEVSLEMYGVKLFNEKYYFPLKSASQYMDTAEQQAKGEVKLKNSGFTKETKEHASKPIVLENFSKVWANHINEMSMYHAFVLPLEDFYRVYNYEIRGNGAAGTEGVKASVQNAHGTAAISYIEQMLKDLNGGAVNDSRETLPKSLVSKHKKAATMASLSVIVQQPTAIFRAMSLIDPKYFKVSGAWQSLANHKKLWNEVKKSAPVALIKEMGRFDINIGQSAEEYLNGKEYRNPWDEGFDWVDEKLSRPAEWMDEYAWNYIWYAVKRETISQHPKMNSASEEFMEIAGSRFTEVIAKTQVYDSVLSRSANMRSKGLFMTMATSFMAEPTTSINMLQSAMLSGNKKTIVRTTSAVLASTIVNAALVSFVYAMRDDDKDETYWEKYLASLTGKLLEGINPLTYIPFTRDIWSILQGFDVERADMSLISDAVDALKALVAEYIKDTEDMDNAEMEEHTRAILEGWLSVADTLGSFAGLPVRNVRREINAIINTVFVANLDKTRITTKLSVRHTVEAELLGSIPVIGWVSGKTSSDKLYEAIIAGDATYVDRLRATYKTEDSYNAHMRKALREHDSRILQAAQAHFDGDFLEYERLLDEIEAEGNFSYRNIKGAIDSEIRKLEEEAKGDSGETASDSKDPDVFTGEDYYISLRDGNKKAAEHIYAYLFQNEIDEGYLRHQAKSNVQSALASQIKSAYMDKEIVRKDALKLLEDHAGKGETEIKKWDFEMDTGFSWGARARGYYLKKIPEKDLVAAVMDIEGEDMETAVAYIDFLDLAKANEDISITASQAAAYFEYGKRADIEVNTWMDYQERTAGITNDVDENGESISYSAVQKKMAVINSLSISPEQKTAIAKSENWSEKTFNRYKLW